MNGIASYLASKTSLSRREVAAAIIEGRVKVNGDVVQSVAAQINPASDLISFNGEVLRGPAKLFYYKFHKPKSVICSLKDPTGRTDLQAYMRGLPESVFPVGRLDRQTSGLLIFTNDGMFANEILHPSREISKTYEVVLDEKVKVGDLKRLEAGFFLDDGPVRFTKADARGNPTLIVTISEGRNRIVRRALEFLGYRVKELKRTAIGGVGLGRLKVGEIREFLPRELRILGF